MDMTVEIEIDWVSQMNKGISSDEREVQIMVLQSLLRLAEEKAEFLDLGFVLINITDAIAKLEKMHGDKK